MSTGRSLRLSGVGRTYVSGGREVEALAPTDLEVAAGEFVCLLGPSGCGKSTLLRCIAGLTDLNAGQLCVAGENITHAPPRLRGGEFEQAAPGSAQPGRTRRRGIGNSQVYVPSRR